MPVDSAWSLLARGEASLGHTEYRALAATGRQADALAAYEALRARLAGELGIDPGSEARAVHLEVLRGEIAAAPAPAGRVRTNLRAQLTSFVGRTDEVARVGKALQAYRLITLVGPGGAGKTRLAAEVAAAVRDSAPDDAADGIWLAELAPVTDAADVPQAVLGAIGLRESRLLPDGTQRITSRDGRTRLLEGLADARALLVLDNCEHLIDACAHLADALLAHSPQLRIVATSREPLGITGESLFVVPPLDEDPAVRLFADRAAAVRPDFSLDSESRPLVIDIVRRLDGLPLAIELAAARLRTLPLAEISRRLTDRFRLLTGGSRTALPRHRTLRAVVEWSWELLTPAERLLAERFSVFPAGATPAAVAAVCAGRGCAGAELTVGEADELLSSLVDKSLLQPLVDGTRLRMLETIREYGAEKHGRMRVYLDQARAGRDEWLSAAAWLMTAGMAENHGDFDEMRVSAIEAVDRFRALGERWGLSMALRTIGNIQVLDGDLDGAVAAFTEASYLLAELGHREDLSQVQLRLAEIAARRGDLAKARQLSAAARSAVESEGSPMDRGIAAAWWAAFEARWGDVDAARPHQAAAERHLAQFGPAHPAREHLEAMVAATGARIAIADKDLRAAREQAGRSYHAAVAAQDMPLLALASGTAAELALALGQPERAAELLGAGAVVRGADDPTDPTALQLVPLLRAASATTATRLATRPAGHSPGRTRSSACDPAGLG